jgi:SNF2 family DNA or RNA helicase
MDVMLHASWQAGRLHVWGEGPSPDGRLIVLSAADLRAWIGERLPDALLASVAGESVLPLLLPGDDRGPLASPGGNAQQADPVDHDASGLRGHRSGFGVQGSSLDPGRPEMSVERRDKANQTPKAPTSPSQPARQTDLLITEPRATRNAPVPLAHLSPDSLVRVEIPMLTFRPADAIDLLSALPNEVLSGSESLRYWARLARLVVDRLAQEQFYPRVEPSNDGGYQGVWRLLIQSPDELAWLERFAGIMPPVCRALADAATEESDSRRMVETFLSATADAVIRRDLANDPFFEQIHARSAELTAPPESRWLSALVGPDARIRGDRQQNELLFEQAQAWTAAVESDAADVPLRLCFVLQEPGEKASGFGVQGSGGEEPETADVQRSTSNVQQMWRVSFALRTLDEERQLLPIEPLFEQTTATPTLLGRTTAHRRAVLLAELGRAVESFPPLERTIPSPRPTHIDLPTQEAHFFLRHWSRLLVERGFEVILPDWAHKQRRQPVLELVVRPFDEGSGIGTQGPGAKEQHGGWGPGAHSAGFGLDSLLEFDWQVAVGEMKLDARQFRELVTQDSPLVRLGGQWVQIDTDQAERALAFLERRRPGQMTFAAALRTAYGASREDPGLPVAELRGEGWVEQLLQQTPAMVMQQLEQPGTFHGQLRAYQLRGLQWLAFLARLGIGGCLADDMGLGKTIQLIALLLHEREVAGGERQTAGGPKTLTLLRERLDEGGSSADEGRTLPQPLPQREGGEPHATGRMPPATPGPTLLFAPTSVVGNWVREIERFAPSLRVLVHHGPERLSGKRFVEAAAKHDVVITSYALAHRDRDDLMRPPWYRIALDEAQKIKNPSAAATLAIRSFEAPQRVAMTGTPIENHLAELWSIMDMLNPGLLGSAGEFRERFAVPIEKLQDQERAQRLRRMVRPFILRRTKNNPEIAGDLPEKLEMKVFCNLTPEQAAIYEQITSQMLNRIDAAAGIQRRGLILAALTRLKQACNHPALIGSSGSRAQGSVEIGAFPNLDPRTVHSLDGRSGKCERLVEMLEEAMEEGDAALVFTQFRQMGHLLEKLLPERLNTPVLFLHGGTPAAQRQELIQQFQSPDGPARIFLLSLRAGGLGLNLTRANHVFHFDRWWNPAVEAQATDRAHRIGQTRAVQVHKFVCIGTVEERIDRLLTEKAALADQIVGGGDEWLTNLSTEQLREYLSLSKEAVAEYGD